MNERHLTYYFDVVLYYIIVNGSRMNESRNNLNQARALKTYIALMRAVSALSDRAHEHLGEHKLSISQFGVLEALLHLGPMSAGELAGKILCKPANMTTVLDNLEKRRLVERRRGDTDRRRLSVALTDSGRALISAIFPAHARGLTREMSKLSAQEQRDLMKLCFKLGVS